MTKPCGRSAAAPLVSVAVAMRLIWLLFIDYTGAANASWFCPWIGFILYLPVGVAVKAVCDAQRSAVPLSFGEKAKFARVLLSFIVVAALVTDASACMRLLSNTANVMALGEVPLWLLALPLGAVIFICTLLGMEPGGYSAGIWIRLSLPLLLVLLLVQLPDYMPAWLTPVFGGGWAAILEGGLRCAGAIALLSTPWLICTEDTNHRSPIPYALAGAAAASIVLFLLSMLAPAVVHTQTNYTARIEMLLGNGRVHLMLQLITVALWFGGLLHLLNTECTAAAGFIAGIAPQSPRWLAPALISVVATLLCIYGNRLSAALTASFAHLLFPLICAVMLVFVLLSHPHGKEHAE